MWIYKITNKINNKAYIGQTVEKNPNRRIHRHFNQKQYRGVSLIKSAIMKYGKDSFDINLIYKATSIEELNNKEQEFIKMHNTLNPNGYNLDRGGRNKRWTPEMREHLGKILNKKPAYFKGKKFSKEHCANLSKVRKGFTSEARELARKKAIQRMREEGSFVKITAIHITTGKEYKFDTISDCARALGLDAANVSRTARGCRNVRQHRGYRFIAEKYKGQELPLLPENPLKGIAKINKGGYSLTLDKQYIGYRRTMEEVIKLKTEYLAKKKLDKDK